MNIEDFREYCLTKPLVTEEFPFGPEVLVYKVAGKMFALSSVTSFESINLKCDPEYAAELRERYDEVRPGYHMSKKHWNTILTTGTIGDKLLRQWIDDSYSIVVSSLPKKIKEQLNGS